MFRNPIEDLVKYLDAKHPDHWCIWDLRAEGTGYPDEVVHNRIYHFPFPDHHPPPFELVNRATQVMREWLHPVDPVLAEKRIAVIHCKAGKGRTGSMACYYLIGDCGYTAIDAMAMFTAKRMKSGFEGVSIPSQRRYVRYTELWAREFQKEYRDRPVEVLEIHVNGLRNGVQVEVCGFTEGGKKIERYHRFGRHEATIVDEGNTRSRKASSIDSLASSKSSTSTSSKATSEKSFVPAVRDQAFLDFVKGMNPRYLPGFIQGMNPFQSSLGSDLSSSTSKVNVNIAPNSKPPTAATADEAALAPSRYGPDVILRPQSRLILPNSDININLEQRVTPIGVQIGTSVAHFWFNPYFEGGRTDDSGFFEMEWSGFDGINGTHAKGVQALDRARVIWRYVQEEDLELAQTERLASKLQRGQDTGQTKVGKSSTLPPERTGRHESAPSSLHVPNGVPDAAAPAATLAPDNPPFQRHHTSPVISSQTPTAPQ